MSRMTGFLRLVPCLLLTYAAGCGTDPVGQGSVHDAGAATGTVDDASDVQGSDVEAPHDVAAPPDVVETVDTATPVDFDVPIDVAAPFDVDSAGDTDVPDVAGEVLAGTPGRAACDPCESSGVCGAPAGRIAVCAGKDATGGTSGWFCALTCAQDSDCASGSVCGKGHAVEGGAGTFCLPASGTCPCSPAAAAGQWQTACTVQVSAGTCKGVRSCGASGLSECSATTPAAETCNDKDDDCNGQTDEGKSLCDDGNTCTTGETCEAGACKGGSALPCDDANPCTDDSCDKSSGCVHAAHTGPCDDGNPCSEGDTCKDKACLGMGALNCDDKNPCTVDGCDAAGKCTHAAQDGLPCAPEGGNVCSSGGACSAGTCKPGPSKGCDDGNPCTDDACDPKSGCQSKPNSKSCDDGNPCTEGDQCGNGACQGGKNACECQADADCNAKPGGNLCLGKLVCDKSGAKPACVVKAGTAVVCQSGQDTACAVDACDPATGICKPAPVNEGKGCDDGSACTVGDTCAGGACKAGPAAQCDDGNPCTTDSCDAKVGCQHAAGSGSCDDGNACTQGDSCKDKACVPGTPKVCDDANACTVDSCDTKTGNCVKDGTALAGKSCSSGQGLCVQSAACQAGVCQAGPAVSCDDSNPCTTDTCDPASGCKHAPGTGACTDGNACTDDTCSAGKCASVAKNCDDANPCTTDSCGAATGACGHVAIAGCLTHSQVGVGGAFSDQMWSVAATSDGGMVAVGETESWGAGAGDALAVRTDSCGNPVWAKTFGGTGKDNFYHVAATADGGFLMAGTTYSTDPSGNLYVVRIDGNGLIQWVWTGGGDNYDFAKWVAPTADGGCVVTGKTYSFGPATPDVHSGIVVKLDAAGKQQWSRIFGGPKGGGSMDTASIAEVQDKTGKINGFLVVGGSENWSVGKDDVWLMRLAPDGSHLWSVAFGGTGDDDPQTGLVQTSDHGFVVSFWETGLGAVNSDIGALKIDADGALVWMKRYGGGGKAEPYAMTAVGQDIVITGYTNSWGAGGIDAFVLKVASSSGALQWLRTYGGKLDEASQGIALLPDGGLALAGRTNSSGKGGFDAWLAIVGPDGAVGCQDVAATGVTGTILTPTTTKFTPVLLSAGTPGATTLGQSDVTLSGTTTGICTCQ